MTTAHRWGVALLAVVGGLQVVYGLAAVSGYGPLRESVRDIESNPNYGKLYFSLAVWGVLLLLVGSACVWSARKLQHDARHARMGGLCAALVGLGLAFFTLAIFHVASLVSVVLLLMTLYVLSYRVEDPPDTRGPFG